MEQIVKINASEYGIEETKAQEIASQFKPMLDKMVELESEFNEVIKMELNEKAFKAAKELRLKYVKVRTGTASIHKTQKAFFLAGGRFVDGWKNAQEFASHGKESALEKIEKHQENLERERVAKLQAERLEQLKEFGGDAGTLNYGSMNDEIWNNFYLGAKANFQLKKDAEAKAEQDRLEKEKAEQAERERVKAENEKLKAENEAKEKELEKEREKQRQLEKELNDKKEAEAKAKADEEARAEAELSKGDKSKFEDLVKELEDLKSKYSFKSTIYKSKQNAVNTLIDKIINHVK